jgi:hypothetical protein
MKSFKIAVLLLILLTICLDSASADDFTWAPLKNYYDLYCKASAIHKKPAANDTEIFKQLVKCEKAKRNRRRGGPSCNFSIKKIGDVHTQGTLVGTVTTKHGQKQYCIREDNEADERLFSVFCDDKGNILQYRRLHSEGGYDEDDGVTYIFCVK